MPLDPSQIVTAAATGLVLGAAKVVELLGKRKRLRNQSRQLDRMEAKVDALNESQLETQHRLAMLEEKVGLPPYRPVRVNGVAR